MLFNSLLYQTFEPKRLTYGHGSKVENSNTMSIANNDYLQVYKYLIIIFIFYRQ